MLCLQVSQKGELGGQDSVQVPTEVKLDLRARDQVFLVREVVGSLLRLCPGRAHDILARTMVVRRHLLVNIKVRVRPPRPHHLPALHCWRESPSSVRSISVKGGEVDEAVVELEAHGGLDLAARRDQVVGRRCQRVLRYDVADQQRLRHGRSGLRLTRSQEVQIHGALGGPVAVRFIDLAHLDIFDRSARLVRGARLAVTAN